MKLFGYILITVLISLPGVSFAQSPIEKDPLTETAPIEKVEPKETKADVKEPETVELLEMTKSPGLSLDMKSAPNTVAERPVNEIKKESSMGKVIAIDEDEFVIDLGSNDGLKESETVEFFKIRKKGFGDEEVTVLDPITLGQVLEVTKKHARVRIPMNVDVPIGSAVMKVDRLYTDNALHRSKVSGTELGLTVRPFIPLDTLGIGAVIDFEATHRFENMPLSLGLVFSPVAFAITDRGQPNFMTFYGQASYDTKYFEIGLGLGGAKKSDFGFAATQFLRVGTHDGLNFKLTTYLIGIEKFEFQGLKLSGQLPVHALVKNSWLIGRMSFQGEDHNGLGYAEVGVRTLVKGRGTSGSVFLTPFIGAVGITETVPGTEEQCEYLASDCKVDQKFAGPSVGLSIEWRP